jgi:hypothetical protein
MRTTNAQAMYVHDDGRPVLGRKRSLLPWAAGCGLLLCAAAWTAHADAAEHLVGIIASNTTGCGTDASNNYYFAEAWGYDSSGNIVCEVAEIAGIQEIVIQSFGECHGLLGNAVTHAAAITTRNPNNNFAYVSTVVQTGRTSTWDTASTQLSFRADCGGTITAQSAGFDTTSN